MAPQSLAVLRSLAARAARSSGRSGRSSRVPDLDEAFCRRVADRYDQEPLASPDGSTAESYHHFRTETREQFRLIREASIDVVPWDGGRTPYRDSRELHEDVLLRGQIKVLLTSAAHGPRPPLNRHPLRAAAGVRAHGRELTYNDLFRAVHDVFGHALGRFGFGPRGEFGATDLHMPLYSPRSRAVLFTEQIGQICWFFYGAHLRDASGRLPRRGEQGYVPPGVRPYPDQKVFLYEPEFLESFERMCSS
jgi:hypothetical protein